MSSVALTINERDFDGDEFQFLKRYGFVLPMDKTGRQKTTRCSLPAGADLYGPEEFVLKVAKPGRYEVRGKFFGSRQQRFSPYTTITAHFITGFGTKNQKEDSVIVRLPEKGNEVSIGSFEVKPD